MKFPIFVLHLFHFGNKVYCKYQNYLFFAVNVGKDWEYPITV